MKLKLLLILLGTVLSLFMLSCEDEDDPVMDDNNQGTNTGAGSGGGAGNGGGTGSGGIPPNSMKVTVDGIEIVFDSVSAAEASGLISIFGFTDPDPYPFLRIDLNTTLSSDTFWIPNAFVQPAISYEVDSSNRYSAASGYLTIRNIDTSRNLVNGRFELIMKNENDLTDSLIFTKGEYNKFYD